MKTLPDHPLECTCPPLLLGMASPTWAVAGLTGFKDKDGKPCELRARLGTKVIYNCSSKTNTFKGDAAELVFEELSPKSSMRPLSLQGPLELRTPAAAVPHEFHTHITQHSSVFPGDLIVRSPLSPGDMTRELVLADMFDRFPAAVDALRRNVFERSSRGTSETLPWFGTRCAFLSIRIRVFSFVADAMHLLPCIIGSHLRRGPMAGPLPARSSVCILLSSLTRKQAGLLYIVQYPPPPLACGGQSSSPACGGHFVLLSVARVVSAQPLRSLF